MWMSFSKRKLISQTIFFLCLSLFLPHPFFRASLYSLSRLYTLWAFSVWDTFFLYKIRSRRIITSYTHFDAGDEHKRCYIHISSCYRSEHETKKKVDGIRSKKYLAPMLLSSPYM